MRYQRSVNFIQPHQTITADYLDLLDHKVIQSFYLAAGDYTVFVGGSDYASQFVAPKSLGISGTLSVVSAVPEPESYAMLLAGQTARPVHFIIQQRVTKRNSNIVIGC